MWYEAHPLIQVLAKSGRAAVLRALQESAGPWTMRGLAHKTGLAPTAVSRAVKEFAALGLVEHLQPGRDHHIALRTHPWLDALATPWPTLHDVLARCAAGFNAPTIWWRQVGEQPLLGAPMRIAVLTSDEEAFWDVAARVLDDVQSDGWLAPELTPVQSEADLEGEVVARA